MNRLLLFIYLSFGVPPGEPILWLLKPLATTMDSAAVAEVSRCVVKMFIEDVRRVTINYSI